jgi:hypothetical protein
MAKSKLLGEALPKFLPEDADEKLKKETFEAVQSAAITQLALKKPDENSEAAIKEKLAELLAVQAQTREFVIADIYNQHKEEVNIHSVNIMYLIQVVQILQQEATMLK